MQRNDLALLGAGGAGNKLVDTIMDIDARFQGYFFNISHTDIEDLNNKDDLDKNYLCISQLNGTGRDRELGKKIATKKGWSMLDMIEKIDAKTLFIATSLGGGSGNSITSVLLNAFDKMKEDGELDKVINLILILPDLNSADIILENTLAAWHEISLYNCINNIFFIDNNNTFDGMYLDKQEINERFANLFDSIFEIPNVNGRDFDSGNLRNIINSKGCTYIYDLPSGYSDINDALTQAEKNSVLAKIYKTEKNIAIDDDGNELMKCGYIGTSFNDENYKNEDILTKYKYTEENYSGYNDENNLVLLTGCLPPFYSFQVIKAELDDRYRKDSKMNNDFSKYSIDYNKDTMTPQQTITNKNNNKHQNKEINVPNAKEHKKNIKKVMKKNLFDMY